MKEQFCIGIDYGTDSVRALLVNAGTGEELATSVFNYPRWERGLYCHPERNQFRQHPLDYIEGLEYTVREIVRKVPGAASRIRAISIDTTGSTPVAVDSQGSPLSLLPEFSNDPDAMFILWKDHTAVREADQINNLCRSRQTDYSRYSGGAYSSEWFWAKLLHVVNINNKVAEAAYSWVEHCDWMPALLTGNTLPSQMIRCRSAAGHKAMWHPEWGGLPPADFLNALHPVLGRMRDHLYSDTVTADFPAGLITRDWAKKLGLPRTVIIGTGAMDSHFGFAGGGIEPYTLCKVTGTSTVDMIIAPVEEITAPVPGICGQVNGSVIPGMMSLEAGQSAFGDVYAWFRDLLLWPLRDNSLTEAEKRTTAEIGSRLITRLSDAAMALAPANSRMVALDWLNGRRSPDVNPRLMGALTGLTLGTDAPAVFRALVEATAFGSRKIMERYKESGIPMKKEIIAMGGVAGKSPLVMQILADVLNCPVKTVSSGNVCALGAAMFAAVAAGIHPSVQKAQQIMGSGFDLIYEPIRANVPVYKQLYDQYEKLGPLCENFWLNHQESFID